MNSTKDTRLTRQSQNVHNKINSESWWDTPSMIIQEVKCLLLYVAYL